MKQVRKDLVNNVSIGLLASVRVPRKRRMMGFWLSLLFLSLGIFAFNISHASEATADLWSFRFDDLPISDVFKQLTQVTGVSVFTNKSLENKRITRSYEDQTVEQIIRDVLRGASYTLEWHSNEDGLESVTITFIGQGRGGSHQSSGGDTSPETEWTVERDSDYETPQSEPQVRRPRQPFRSRPPARTRSARPTENRSDPDDEEIADEDVSESGNEEEEPMTVPEPAEDDAFAGEAEPPDEAPNEAAEDEEIPATHHGEESGELED